MAVIHGTCIYLYPVCSSISAGTIWVGPTVSAFFHGHSILFSQLHSILVLYFISCKYSVKVFCSLKFLGWLIAPLVPQLSLPMLVLLHLLCFHCLLFLQDLLILQLMSLPFKPCIICSCNYHFHCKLHYVADILRLPMHSSPFMPGFLVRF